MYRKKTIAGYTLIVVGITALICSLVFVFLRYNFVLKPDIDFEEEQTFQIRRNISLITFQFREFRGMDDRCRRKVGFNKFL